jgi:hypothetical protein
MGNSRLPLRCSRDVRLSGTPRSIRGMFIIVYRHVSSRVCLTLEGGTDTLSRNVDKLPAYYAKYSRKRRPQNVKLL